MPTLNSIITLLQTLNTDTHMPFAVPNGPFLFCVKDPTTNKWSPQLTDGNLLYPLVGGPAPEFDRCTPVGEIYADNFVWSFVDTYPGPFSIQKSFGSSANYNSTGFELITSACFTQKESVIENGQITIKTLLEFNGVVYAVENNRQILAVVPDVLTNGVIITTYSVEEKNRAILLTRDGEIKEITLPDGSAPYKPAFQDNGIWYAEKTGANWEDRKISWANTYNLTPLNAELWLKPTTRGTLKIAQ